MKIVLKILRKFAVLYSNVKITATGLIAVTVIITLTGCSKDKDPEPVTLQFIVVTAQPAKKTYLVNEEFDPTGMEITAIYSDKTTTLVTTFDFTYDFDMAGTGLTVTITYEGKTAEVTGITVNAESGVLIRGTRWATRNVGMPGKFASYPHSRGMLYQFNRKKAYNSYSSTVEDWDSTIPTGTTWEAANDPCPAGWRVPSAMDINSLVFYTNSRWAELNDVWGRFFGESALIFLPAAGVRRGNDGFLNYGIPFNSYGFYWSNYSNLSLEGYYLGFNKDHVSSGESVNDAAFSVRCVADS